MTKTLREKVDAARLHANDHAYDKQREFDDADRLSDLGDDVKRLGDRIDDVQNMINYHGAVNEEQDAAIDVLTDELADANKLIMGLARHVLRDEELIGIDDDVAAARLGDGVTIVELVADHQDRIDEIDDHADDIDAQIDVLRDPAADSPLAVQIADNAAEQFRYQLSFDAKLRRIEKRFSEVIESLQKQINKDPGL